MTRALSIILPCHSFVNVSHQSTLKAMIAHNSLKKYKCFLIFVIQHEDALGIFVILLQYLFFFLFFCNCNLNYCLLYLCLCAVSYVEDIFILQQATLNLTKKLPVWKSLLIENYLRCQYLWKYITIRLFHLYFNQRK